MYLAIDPGTKCSGLALFDEDKQLVWACSYEREKDQQLFFFALAMLNMVCAETAVQHQIQTVWIELPHDQGRSRPDNLILLGRFVGILEGLIGSWFRNIRATLLVKPYEWKRTLPKPKSTRQPYIVETRIRLRLTPQELVVLDKGLTQNWDMFDAVGLGLVMLGRLQPGLVL